MVALDSPNNRSEGRPKEINPKIVYTRKVSSSNIPLQYDPLARGLRAKRDLELFRELINISSNTKSQIIETLSFFKKNPVYLQRKEYQNLFESLVLAPELLEEEIRRNPKISFQLNSFFKKNIEFLLQLDASTLDYKLVAFFLRMSDINLKMYTYYNLEAFETREHYAQKVVRNIKIHKDLDFINARKVLFDLITENTRMRQDIYHRRIISINNI